MAEPELNIAESVEDGPAVLEIDHGVVKKVRRGRQRVERPKPDPFKVMLSGESERTGLGLRHIHSLLPTKVLKEWGNVDDMVEHCLRRPQDVAVDHRLATAIKTVYQTQPDKDGFLGLGIRSTYDTKLHNGTYGTSQHPAKVGRTGGLDTTFLRATQSASRSTAVVTVGENGATADADGAPVIIKGRAPTRGLG